MEPYLVRISGYLSTEISCSAGHSHLDFTEIVPVEIDVKPSRSLVYGLNTLLEELNYACEETDNQGKRVNVLYTGNEIKEAKIDVLSEINKPFDFFVRARNNLVRFQKKGGRFYHNNLPIDHRSRLSSLLGETDKISLEYFASPGAHLPEEKSISLLENNLVDRLENIGNEQIKRSLLDDLEEYVINTSVFEGFSIDSLSVMVAVAKTYDAEKSERGLSEADLEDSIYEISRANFCECHFDERERNFFEEVAIVLETEGFLKHDADDEDKFFINPEYVKTKFLVDLEFLKRKAFEDKNQLRLFS